MPLIGEQGWPEDDDDRPRARRARAAAHRDAAALHRSCDRAQPPSRLPDLDDPAFAALFDRFGDARVVLLGEASHGTSEFYRARAAITRRLIERHGFSFVAVEADWPDAAAHRPLRAPSAGAREGAEPPFQRFPTWMWRNTDVEAFVDWLRAHNAALPPSAAPASTASTSTACRARSRAVLAYLDDVDPDGGRRSRASATAASRRGSTTRRPTAARADARLSRAARRRWWRCCATARPGGCDYAARDGDAFFDAAQNARLVAQRRALLPGDVLRRAPSSWNLRDRHMFETLAAPARRARRRRKAVVWAHNSHIGDARPPRWAACAASSTSASCAASASATQAALIGFGTHAGTVAAADDWDGPMEVKAVRPVARGQLRAAVPRRRRSARFLLDLRDGRDADCASSSARARGWSASSA